MKTFPDTFHLVEADLPPMLMDMIDVYSRSQFIDVYSRSQFIGLFYQGTKATWSDGRDRNTFNFYQVWQPLSSHPKITKALREAIKADYQPSYYDDEVFYSSGFGSDESMPTHILVCDRQHNKMAVASWNEGMQMLNHQHPITPILSTEEQAALYQAIKVLETKMNLSPAQMNRRGMFELLLSVPDPTLVAQRESLIKFLNEST